MRTTTRGVFFSLVLIAALVALVTGTGAAAETLIDVSLTSAHASGVFARATLTSRGGATIVLIVVTGENRAQYLPDLRTGTCAHAAKAPEIPLAPVSNGLPSSTTVDLPLEDLRLGHYVIMLHRLDGRPVSLEPSSAVACGAIGPAQPAAAIVNAAPATGVGPIGVAARRRWPTFVIASAAAGALMLARRVQARGQGR